MAPKNLTFMGSFTLGLTALQMRLVYVEDGNLQGFLGDPPRRP